MKIMVLAAGLGKRLLPHSHQLPKPLFPVLDKTLLQTTIETAVLAKPELIVINTYHLAEMIERYVASMDFGVKIIISHENEIMGTAGGINFARKWLDGNDFAVINSDMIIDVPWTQLVEFHKQYNSTSTLMLRKFTGDLNYSPLAINNQGRVTRLAKTKNPDHNSESSPLIFTGVSILSPKIFDLIPNGRYSDIVGEIYSPMVESSGPLFGYEHNGIWKDAGTLRNYHRMIMDELGNNRCITSHSKSSNIIDPVFIHSNATLENGCCVGPSAAIYEGATIKNGAVVKNSVVMPESVVEKGESIDGVIR
ncbi:MAG TPA: NDP-sugar synthase [Nitrospinota bacterium]|nr:NDP-sugar synthase [Nitrospinota bacterium]|tara:strand:+ start:205194 stop:206117 length:924 start_codon:yes stop_codon:yes gene_type:complete